METLMYDFAPNKKHTGLLQSRFIYGMKTFENIDHVFKKSEANRKIRRKDSIAYYHTIISMSPLDTPILQKADQSIYRKIALRYISQRCPKAPSISVVHRDKVHHHIHLIYAGVNYMTGQGSWVTTPQFQQIKKDITRYGLEELGLVYSDVDHDKKKSHRLTKGEYRINKRGLETQKQKIHRLVTEGLKRSNSYEQLIQLLKRDDINFYFRRGVQRGLTYKSGRKFRFESVDIKLKEIQHLYQQQLDHSYQYEL